VLDQVGGDDEIVLAGTSQNVSEATTGPNVVDLLDRCNLVWRQSPFLVFLDEVSSWEMVDDLDAGPRGFG